MELTYNAKYLFKREKNRQDGSIRISHVVLIEDAEEMTVRDDLVSGNGLKMGDELTVKAELRPANIAREYEGRSYTTPGLELAPVDVRAKAPLKQAANS